MKSLETYDQEKNSEEKKIYRGLPGWPSTQQCQAPCKSPPQSFFASPPTLPRYIFSLRPLSQARIDSTGHANNKHPPISQILRYRVAFSRHCESILRPRSLPVKECRQQIPGAARGSQIAGRCARRAQHRWKEDPGDVHRQGVRRSNACILQLR